MLGDFGSARTLGVHADEVTTGYWPDEMESDPGAAVLATSAEVDFLLLAVTLLELAGAYQPGVYLEGRDGPIAGQLREAAKILSNTELRSLVIELLGGNADDG